MEFNNTKENMIDEIEPTPKKYDYTKEIWLRELNYLNPIYRWGEKFILWTAQSKEKFQIQDPEIYSCGPGK